MSYLESCIFELKIITTKSIILSINKYSEQLTNRKDNTQTESNSNLIKELFQLKIKPNKENVFNNPLKKVKPNILVENIDDYYLDISEEFKIKLINNLTKNEDLCNLLMSIDDDTMNDIIDEQIQENNDLVHDLRELMNKTIEFHSSPLKEENSSNKSKDQAIRNRSRVVLPEKKFKSREKKYTTRQNSPHSSNLSDLSNLSNSAVVNQPATSSAANLSEARATSSKSSKKELKTRKESLSKLLKQSKSIKDQTSTKIPVVRVSERRSAKKLISSLDDDSCNELEIAEMIDEKSKGNKKIVKFELINAKEFLEKFDHERRTDNFTYLNTDWCLEIYSGQNKKNSERYLCIGLCCNKREPTDWKIFTNFKIGVENFKDSGKNIYHEFKNESFEYTDPNQMISEDEFINYELLNEEAGFLKDDRMVIYCELTGRYE